MMMDESRRMNRLPIIYMASRSSHPGLPQIIRQLLIRDNEHLVNGMNTSTGSPKSTIESISSPGLDYGNPLKLTSLFRTYLCSPHISNALLRDLLDVAQKRTAVLCVYARPSLHRCGRGRTRNPGCLFQSLWHIRTACFLQTSKE